MPPVPDRTPPPDPRTPQDRTPQDRTPQTAAESLDPAAARHLHVRLQREQTERRVPSVVAALVRGRELVWADGVGEVDGAVPTADTQYRIGSITKTLVAVAVMQLRDEGALDLQDRAADHLPPTWRGEGGRSPAPLERATVGQLLMHAGGLGAETGGPWWERVAGEGEAWLAADLVRRGAAGPPARRFHYSNVGFGVLGAVVAHHRQQPWDDVVRDRVLRPLGMDRTTPRPEAPAAAGLAVHPWADLVLPEPEHDGGAMAPAGQLWSTATDMARWVRFLDGDVGDVLDADTLEEMCVPGVVDHRPGQAWTTAMGLGIQVFNADGTTWVGHGGSMPGFLAQVQVRRGTGLGSVVLRNTTSGGDPCLADDLLALLDAHHPVAAEPWRPTPSPADVREVTGLWYWGPAPIGVRATGEDLELAPTAGGGRASRFRRTGPDAWIGQDGYYAGEPLRLVRHDDGRPRHLDLASFILTRTPYDPEADVPGGVDPDGWR